MRSGTIKSYDTNLYIFFVNKQPIRIDMALPISFVITMEKMVTTFFRKWFICS